jgi:ATP-dependent helicase HrpB
VLAILDAGLSQHAHRLTAQIRRKVRPSRQSAKDYDPLLIALLMAFPDRVARRRSGYELLLAAGGSARLSAASVVRRHDLLLGVDIEERKETGLPLVRLASAVRPEWLFDRFPDRVTDRTTVEWNRRSERVEAVSALYFDQIVIEESRGGNPDPALASALLAGKAAEAGIGRFTDLAALDAFVNRVAFASEYTTVPRLTESDIREALEVLCYGLRSFRDLSSAAGNGGLLKVLRNRLSSEQRLLLSEFAPERIQLRRGRRSRIHYAAGKPPWTASRLQDFFGMTETPRIARGAVPLVLHLLAPSQRPVQTTTDLAGFWKRLYPAVRRELRRRYPKHSWPEDPLL